MIKTIYTFTFKESNTMIVNFNNNIKVLACIMYEELKNLDCESLDEILIYNKKIHDNPLYEFYNGSGYDYRFESEKNNLRYSRYNPMYFTNNSFAITVNNKYIDKDTLILMLKRILKELNLDYQFEVIEVFYLSKNIDDESNREGAIRKILDSLSLKKSIFKSLKRKRIIER